MNPLVTSPGGIKAVVFDVYGTLVEIRDRRRPYARLLQLLADSGRVPRDDDAARLMSTSCDLEEAVHLLGAELPASKLAPLEMDLIAELASVTLYPDTVETLAALRRAGVKIGVCSNLAAPYAIPVLKLLPFALDAYAWSFETGAVKPDAAIYRAACQRLACAPEEVLFIGDTLEADHLGPRAINMQSLHLVRKGSTQTRDTISTLAQLPEILKLLT
jgi:HAD superfamily hydrolase (TIGR01493 family)